MTYSIRHRRLYLVSWRSYYQIRPRPRPRPRPPPQRRPCSTLPSWSLPFVTVPPFPPSLSRRDRHTRYLEEKEGEQEKEGASERVSVRRNCTSLGERGNGGDDRSIDCHLSIRSHSAKNGLREGKLRSPRPLTHVATFFLPAAQTAVLRGADSSLVKGY